jgi:hypothetical protein
MFYLHRVNCVKELLAKKTNQGKCCQGRTPMQTFQDGSPRKIDSPEKSGIFNAILKMVLFSILK